MSYEISKNNPSPDVSNPGVLEDMQSALKKVRGELGRSYAALIGGTRHFMFREWFKSTDPANPDEIIGVVPQVDAARVDLAGENAYSAFKPWGDPRNFERRRDVLLKSAEVMRKKIFELAAWTVFELGKSWHEALEDINEAIDFVELYARHGDNYLTSVLLPSTSSEENYLSYFPRGIVGAICPFNFVSLTVEKIAAALIMGCPVLVKPAEQTPVICYHVVQCFLEAGVPPYMIAYLPGRAETGKALVKSSFVSYVLFTGSQTVGREIKAQKDAETEEGSNNPLIICESADLDHALDGILHSAFSYSGQKCSRSKRLIIIGDPESRRSKRNLERLYEAVLSLELGPPEDPWFQYGPLIDKRAQEKVQKTMDGLQQAAQQYRVLPRPELPGHYVGVGVFVGVPHNHPLAREETFGPVLLVFYAPTLEMAMALANDADFQLLTAGIYTSRTDEWNYFEQNMRAGNLYLNRPIVGAKVGRQPFGNPTKVGLPERLRRLVQERACTRNLTLHGTLVDKHFYRTIK